MDFYSCYLLSSKSHCDRCYIGSTPNPIKRIRQHNGEIKGGAAKTLKNRPWNMVLVVHGFPSRNAALQFEWAWQHPHLSRHLKDRLIGTTLNPQNNEEFSNKDKIKLNYKLVILTELLQSPSFRRWPLKILLTDAHVAGLFSNCAKLPEPHIDMLVGNLDILKSIDMSETNSITIDDSDHSDCLICMESISIHDMKNWVKCPIVDCGCRMHLLCLSDWFLSEEQDALQLIPVSGTCPNWSTIHWGKVIHDLKKREKDCLT